MFEDIEEYITGVVSDALTHIEDTTSCMAIANKFPAYDPDWCADDWPADLESRRQDIIDATVSYLIDTLYYNE